MIDARYDIRNAFRPGARSTPERGMASMMKLDGKGLMTAKRYQATEQRGQSPLPEGDKKSANESRE